MSIKTHHSTLSTTSTQWNYQLNTINSYKTNIKTEILYYHKKHRESQLNFTKDFHRNYIKSKLCLLDIPIANAKTRNKNIFITYQNTLPINDYKPSLITQTSFPLKQLNIIDQHKPYHFNPLLSEALNTNHGKFTKKETATQFLNKTKAMIKAKQIAEYQSEKLIEMNEEITSHLQEIESKIYLIKDCQQKLQYFHETRGKYLNHLYMKIEEEKKIVMSLGAYRSELEKCIKELNMKINKNNILLQISKQYKIFLIMVKCKVASIEQVSSNDLKLYGIITQSFAREAFMKRNSINPNISNNKRKSIINDILMTGFNPLHNSPSKRLNQRRCSKLINNETIDEPMPLLHNPPIFSSPDEFISHFNRLESQAITLFSTINNMIYDSKTLYEERDYIEKYNKEIEKEDKDIIELLQEELNKSKEKHEILSKQYAYEKANYNRCASIEILYDKIKAILMKLPFNIEEKFDLPLFYNHMREKSSNIYINGRRENQGIYAIKVLEKVLVYFFTKMNEYKRSIKVALKLRKILFSMEKRKRYDKSKHNQLMEIQRQNKVNEMIHEKYNKVLFIPKRKVYNQYNRNKGRNNKDNSSLNYNNDMNIAELTTY